MPAEKRQSKKAQSLTSSLSVGFPVFVGWGKERAGAVATTLARWLGRVVQQTEAHVSGDIVLGKRWNEELNALLDGAHYAVLVTTREAMLQPWFLFEAGRLSRHGQPAVPYLVDLKPTDLPEPLGQLQATRADEAGTFRLVDSLNALTLKPLQQDDLRQVFAGAWPELHAELEKARKAPLPAPPPRSDGEKLDELLNLVRELRRINDSENRREQVLHELAATIRVSSKAAGTLSSDDPDPLVFQRTLSFLRHLNAQQQLAAVAAVLKKKDEEMPPRRKHRRCAVPDCRNPHLAKGLCRAHYKQKRRLEGPRCSVPGCNRRVSARGLCRGHGKDPTRTIRAATAGRGGSRVLAEPRPALPGRRGCHAGAWLASGTIRDRLQQWPVRVEAIPAPVAAASIRPWSDGPDCPDLGGSSRFLDRGCGQPVHRVPLVEREISRPRRSQCACIS